MKISLIALLIALLSCQEQTTSPETTVLKRTELGYLHDTSQYADGCEPYVEIDAGNPSTFGTRYKPTSASLPVFQKAFKDLVGNQPYSGRLPIRVRFVETGKQAVIHCGWVSPTVTEIEILEITAR